MPQPSQSGEAADSAVQRWEFCGANLALVGRVHRCVPPPRNAETDRNAHHRNAVTSTVAPQRNANAERQARWRKAQKAKRQAERGAAS